MSATSAIAELLRRSDARARRRCPALAFGRAAESRAAIDVAELPTILLYTPWRYFAERNRKAQPGARQPEIERSDQRHTRRAGHSSGSAGAVRRPEAPRDDHEPRPTQGARPISRRVSWSLRFAWGWTVRAQGARMRRSALYQSG